MLNLPFSIISYTNFSFLYLRAKQCSPFKSVLDLHPLHLLLPIADLLTLEFPCPPDSLSFTGPKEIHFLHHNDFWIICKNSLTHMLTQINLSYFRSVFNVSTNIQFNIGRKQKNIVDTHYFLLQYGRSVSITKIKLSWFFYSTISFQNCYRYFQFVFFGYVCNCRLLFSSTNLISDNRYIPVVLLPHSRHLMNAIIFFEGTYNLLQFCKFSKPTFCSKRKKTSISHMSNLTLASSNPMPYRSALLGALGATTGTSGDQHNEDITLGRNTQSLTTT